jgi:hypothetical protein
MRTTMIAIGLLIGTSSCSVKLAENYHVSIDPTFSAQAQADIITSMRNWETALDNRVSFEYGFDADCKRTNSSNLICIHATSKAWIDNNEHMGQSCVGLTIRNSAAQDFLHQDSSDIYLPTDYFAALPQFNVLITSHELGHAMGLNHVHVESAMMYPSVDQENKSMTEASCDDIHQWEDLRFQYETVCQQGE